MKNFCEFYMDKSGIPFHILNLFRKQSILHKKGDRCKLIDHLEITVPFPVVRKGHIEFLPMAAAPLTSWRSAC